MSQGWIIIVTDGDKARRFVVAEPDRAKSLVAQRVPSSRFVRSQHVNGQTLNLYGVAGRKAASVAGFEYSEDLRKSGIVWNEATIDKFITAPKKLFPGTRMELPGVDDEKTRSIIIRFLGSLSD